MATSDKRQYRVDLPTEAWPLGARVAAARSTWEDRLVRAASACPDSVANAERQGLLAAVHIGAEDLRVIYVACVIRRHEGQLAAARTARALLRRLGWWAVWGEDRLSDFMESHSAFPSWTGLCAKRVIDLHQREDRMRRAWKYIELQAEGTDRD